jgi:hypothetical protein
MTSIRNCAAAILKDEDNQKFAGRKFLLGVEDGDYDYIHVRHGRTQAPDRIHGQLRRGASGGRADRAAECRRS